MKYGSYLVEGESARGFCAACVINVMAVWVRDRDDCLWDCSEMRNHYHSNMFMLPVLISAHTHMLQYGQPALTPDDINRHVLAHM